MIDPYLKAREVQDRLYKEWKKHGTLIIAYDFDNTVYDFHDKGYTFNNVINLLRRCKELGAYFIVFTCNPPDKEEAILKYLYQNKIPVNSVNENAPFAEHYGRKIYYNILLDDRAGLLSAYADLLSVVTRLESETVK